MANFIKKFGHLFCSIHRNQSILRYIKTQFK